MTGNKNLIIDNDNNFDIRSINSNALGNRGFISKKNLNFIIDKSKSNNINNNLNSNDIVYENRQLNAKKRLNASGSNVLNLKTSKIKPGSKNKNAYLNNQKVGDSNNLNYLKPDSKEVDKLNLNTDNEVRGIKTINVPNKMFIDPKVKKSLPLVEDKNVSIFRLMCIDAFKKRKKSSPKKLGFFYFYFNNLIEFYDKKFDVFNYLKVCEEFENMKEILFEDYKNEFAKIKTVIDMDPFGVNFEAVFYKQDQSKIKTMKSDRILRNLFIKLK